jgi:hypothetical protein
MFSLYFSHVFGGSWWLWQGPREQSTMSFMWCYPVPENNYHNLVRFQEILKVLEKSLILVGKGFPEV